MLNMLVAKIISFIKYSLRGLDKVNNIPTINCTAYLYFALIWIRSSAKPIKIRGNIFII